MKKNSGDKNILINNNTYELLFSDFDNLPENESATYENTIALKTIECFTKLEETNIATKSVEVANIDLNKIIYNKEIDMFEYRNNDKVITFDRLSDHLQNKDLKKELMSKKRYRKCHERSMNIVPYIKNSKIVTGYVTTGNRKVLHSIIEYDVDNKTIVLDWIRNLYITKEQYVELTEFVELSSFDGRKVIDDSELITGNLDITIKPYLVFREELMRDIKKNSQIFQPTGEGMKKTENVGKKDSSREDEEDLR